MVTCQERCNAVGHLWVLYAVSVFIFVCVCVAKEFVLCLPDKQMNHSSLAIAAVIEENRIGLFKDYLAYLWKRFLLLGSLWSLSNQSLKNKAGYICYCQQFPWKDQSQQSISPSFKMFRLLQPVCAVTLRPIHWRKYQRFNCCSIKAGSGPRQQKVGLNSLNFSFNPLVVLNTTDVITMSTSGIVGWLFPPFWIKVGDPVFPFESDLQM